MDLQFPDEMKDLILKAKASQEEKLKFSNSYRRRNHNPGFKKDPFPFKSRIGFWMQVKRALIATHRPRQDGPVNRHRGGTAAHPSDRYSAILAKANWKREIEEL